MKAVHNFFITLPVALGANITKVALYDVGGKIIICRKYLLKNYFRFLVLAISPLLLSACNPADYINPGACRAFQVFPPRISVTDVRGQWVTGYTVLYKLADGATTEKVCEAASECVLDEIYLYGADSSITVSKNGFESVTAQPKEFIETYSNNDCTSQYTVAITLKALS